MDNSSTHAFEDPNEFDEYFEKLDTIVIFIPPALTEFLQPNDGCINANIQKNFMKKNFYLGLDLKIMQKISQNPVIGK